MAEKANETQAPEKIEKVQQPIPAAAETSVQNDDMFLQYASEETNEIANSRTEDSSVFDTGSFMYRKKVRESEDGRCFYEYFVGLMAAINGKPVKHVIRFKLADEYREAYDQLNIVFDEQNKSPLKIVRTEINDSASGRKTVTYTAKVSILDDEGAEYGFKLKPVNGNDKQEFEYMISKLKIRQLLK